MPTVALLATACLAWKDKPPSDTCLGWCKFDDGENGRVDACTHPFKKLQCQGCERCVQMRAAQDAKMAAPRGITETTGFDCDRVGGDVSEKERILREEISHLHSMAEAQAQSHIQALDSALKRAKEAETAREKRDADIRAVRAQLNAALRKIDMQNADQLRLKGILAILRENQPHAYAVLMLNTAPNATLREVAGSAVRASEIIQRRPWYKDNKPPHLDALRGSEGGIHGFGTERVHAFEQWALRYTP